MLYFFNDFVILQVKDTDHWLSKKIKEEKKILWIDFDETASGDYVLEGGGVGALTIEYENGTNQVKKLGSYFPEPIEELYKFIEDKFNSSNSPKTNNE